MSLFTKKKLCLHYTFFFSREKMCMLRVFKIKRWEHVHISISLDRKQLKVIEEYLRVEVK